MMDLQNEQLANCLSFDEVTFNYAPDGNSSHCLKLICPFWLLPYPRGLCVSGFLPLLLLTSLLPPWVSAPPSSKQIHKQELGPDSILFVKHGPKIGALGKR